jgi:hypothetical protein
MEAKELRIESWVKVHDPIFGVNTYKVVTIRDNDIVTLKNNDNEISCLVSNIEPIELTEEVLVKIGFEDRKGYFNYSKVFGDENNYCDSIHIYYCPRLKHFKFTHDKVKECDLQTMDLYNIQYLHQLQNAYFLISNQEMEIEL